MPAAHGGGAEAVRRLRAPRTARVSAAGPAPSAGRRGEEGCLAPRTGALRPPLALLGCSSLLSGWARSGSGLLRAAGTGREILAAKASSEASLEYAWVAAWHLLSGQLRPRQ